MEERNKILGTVTDWDGPYLATPLSGHEGSGQDLPDGPNIAVTPLRQIFRDQFRKHHPAVIGDLLHEGETMIVTAPPLLSRRFAANLAVAVAGFAHWGSFPIQSGRVLHVTTEPSMAELLDHYQEAGLDPRLFWDNIDTITCHEPLQNFVCDRLPSIVIYRAHAVDQSTNRKERL